MGIKIRYLTIFFACLVIVGFFTSDFSVLGAGSKQNSLEERVQRLEAIEEIKQLHMHYVNCYSGFDEGDIASLFAEDAVCAAFPGEPIKGREAIAELYGRAEGGIDHSKNGIFAVHPMITFEGETAKARWIFFNLVSHPTTNQMLFFVQGIYDAEYVKEDGKWKFSYLKWTERIVPEGLRPGGAS